MSDNRILDEFTKINNELINTKRELTILNREKDLLLQELKKQFDWSEQLVTILAHDLRGSVGTLHGLLNASFLEEMSQSEFAELMPTLRSTTASTYDLLNNILEWIRGSREQSNVHCELVDISGIAGMVCSWMKPQAEPKHILLINEALPGTSALTDPGICATILRNFVSNAVKFSPEQGHVFIRTESRQDKHELCVQVVDEGSGVLPETIVNLTHNEAIRSTVGTKGESGSGLGLRFCMDMAAKIGARIEIISAPGKGSTFSLVMPV